MSAPVEACFYSCLDELGEFLDCVRWISALELLLSAYEAGRGVRLHWVNCPVVEGELQVVDYGEFFPEKVREVSVCLALFSMPGSLKCSPETVFVSIITIIVRWTQASSVLSLGQQTLYTYSFRSGMYTKVIRPSGWLVGMTWARMLCLTT